MNTIYNYSSNNDTAIIAKLYWQDNWLQQITFLDGAYYFATHFTPFFWILQAVSYLIPVGMIEYFGLAQGIASALIGYVVFQQILKLKLDIKYLYELALFLALCAVFTSLNLKILKYHHFEGWFVAFAAMYFMYLFDRKYLPASIWFCLALLTREDSGFHLTGIFLVAIIYQLIFMKKQIEKKWLYYLIIAFGFSIFALYIKSLFPGDEAFQRMYFEPNLHGLLTRINEIEFHEKFKAIFIKNIKFAVPLYIILAWVIYTRKFFYLTGIVAFIPWFLVNLLSQLETLSTMEDYYAFPFILAYLWPLLAYSYYENFKQQEKLRFFIWQFVLIFSAFIVGAGTFYEMYLTKYDYNIANARTYRVELDDFSKHHFENVCITGSMANMLPNSFYSKELLGSQKCDFIFYYAGEHEVYYQIKMWDLKNIFAVNETILRIATNKPYIIEQSFSNLSVINDDRELLYNKKTDELKPELTVGKVKKARHRFNSFIPNKSEKLDIKFTVDKCNHNQNFTLFMQNRNLDKIVESRFNCVDNKQYEVEFADARGDIAFYLEPEKSGISIKSFYLKKLD